MSFEKEFIRCIFYKNAIIVFFLSLWKNMILFYLLYVSFFLILC